MSQIVDRGEGYLAAVRYVLSRLNGGRRAFFACDKESRRELISHIVKTHKHDRNIYSRMRDEQFAEAASILHEALQRNRLTEKTETEVRSILERAWKEGELRITRRWITRRLLSGLTRF